MAITELYEDHKVFDIIDVNGEKHVILTKFERGLYGTKTLKQWIIDNVHIDFVSPADFEHKLMYFDLEKPHGSIAEYIELIAKELIEVGHV